MKSNDTVRVLLYTLAAGILLICSAFPLHRISLILNQDARLSDIRPYEEKAKESYFTPFRSTETRMPPEPILVSDNVVLYGDEDIACHDIIPQMKDYSSRYADWYAYGIADTIWVTGRVNYNIFAMEYDMDDDAMQDVVAYFTSSTNIGSLGNITLDVWTEIGNEASKTTFRDWVSLNPKFKSLEYVRVDILRTMTNGLHDFGITQYVGGKQFQFIYAFDGEMYSKAKWQKVVE